MTSPITLTKSFLVSILSFYLIAITLKTLPLSLAYAIWAGVGTAPTAIVGIVVWGEALSLLKLSSLVLIIGGVVLLNLPDSTATPEQASM